MNIQDRKHVESFADERLNVESFADERLNADGESSESLAQLLDQAYSAPHMPKTLLQRIDQGFVDAGGVSAGLGQKSRSPFTPRIVRLLRLSGSWAAISLAVLFCGLLLLNGAGENYSWAAMVKAMADEPVIRISEQIPEDSQRTKQQNSERVHLLSISDKVLATQRNRQTRLISYQQQVVYDYRQGDNRVSRTLAPHGIRVVPSSTDLIWTVLFGGAMEESQPFTFDLVDETWKRVAENNQQRIQISAEFQSLQDHDRVVRLVALLEPHTNFPDSITLFENGHRARTFRINRIPDQDELNFRLAGIPNRVSIVDLPTEERVVTFGTSKPLTATPSQDFETIILDNLEPEEPRSNTLPTLGEGRKSETNEIASRLGWKPVAARKMSLPQVVQQIDDLLAAEWEQRAIVPAEPATRSELMRRLYLDLIGRIPTVNEAQQFLNSPESEASYLNLIDTLLASPDHASHLASVWRSILIPDGVDLDRFGGTAPFEAWLEREFRSDSSYDVIAKKLILAEGRIAESGPLLFYTAAKLDPEALAARARPRVFLGIKLECAQCHDDPFEPWTQEDFWGFAAFFARISRPQGDLNAVSPVMRVKDVDYGEVRFPETEQVVSPRLLDGIEFVETEHGPYRREALADWLASAENPLFARATANRVWAQMFGKGIVDPVDGLGLANPPVVPELLDLLAAYFVESGFDLGDLYEAIAQTQAYRLSSGTDGADPDQEKYFARMAVTTFSAEQLYDCISVATLVPAEMETTSGQFELQRLGNSARQQFLETFQTPAGRPTEYLRGIPQALSLMNGSVTGSVTGVSSSRLLRSLEAPFFDDQERIRILFLATLSRPPDNEEFDRLTDFLQNAGSNEERKQRFSDILWALLNSSEFSVNH